MRSLLAKLLDLLNYRKRDQEARIFNQAKIMASLRLEQAIWDMRTCEQRKQVRSKE